MKNNKIINFIISRINYLPYYLPLVREGNKRGIESHFFLVPSPKNFISPFYKPHLELITQYSQKYLIKLHPIQDLLKYPSYTFFCEGDVVGQKKKNKPPNSFRYMRSGHTKISLVCNFEFYMFYDKYIKWVDYVIFPIQHYADFYGMSHLQPNKNLFLGSPKYDPVYLKEFLDKSKIIKKYGLPELWGVKYILIVFPKDPKKHKKPNTLYPSEAQMNFIYQTIRRLPSNYKIIVKSRKQDPLLESQTQLRGDYYLEDIDYEPCNSMELIYISDLVIYFSSSINEECVALKTPYIDIKVDMSKNRFPFYYDNKYGIEVSLAYLMRFFPKILNHLLGMDNMDEGKHFNNPIIKEFDAKNYGSSGKILDYFS